MKKYVLFGAGEYANYAVRIIGKSNIVFIVDNDLNKCGTELQGIPVYSFKKKITECREYIVVISVSNKCYDEIATQLKQSGIPDFLSVTEIQIEKNKKKIENLVFLIIILIVTIIIINAIWKKDEISNNTTRDTNSLSGKVLADNSKDEVSNQTELETKLENILSTIKNVGKVNVLINYSESSSLVPLYNESTTTSSTEEGDSGGGTRNVTETESKKDVVFSENSGQKQPVTEKTVMPTIQGAIITAEGAKDANVKTNIINAVGAVTGLSIDKIQVFETNN